MNGIPAKLQKLIDNGYEFKFGAYISRGFSLVQKELGLFIVGILLFIVISGVLGIIPFVGSFITNLVVAPLISVGFYFAGYKVDKGEKLELGDFFKGFDKIGDLVLTALLTLAIVAAAMIPGMLLAFAGGFWEYIMTEDESTINPGLFAGGLALAVIPAIYFGVSYVWSYALVWFYDMKPWPAMETSRKLVGKNWFTIFLFLIVVGLIAALGFILLCVGVLFTIPVGTLSQYAAFADVTGLLDEEDAEGPADIIDHFVPA